MRLKKIAIIDDEVHIIELLQEYLEQKYQNEFEPRTFNSAIEFLEEEDIYDYDLVISDLRMPGMSGLELYLDLLKKGYNKAFIFVTGFSGELDSDLWHFESCYILEKPIDFKKLSYLVVESVHIQERELELQKKMIGSLVDQDSLEAFIESYQKMTCTSEQMRLRERLKLKLG